MLKIICSIYFPFSLPLLILHSLIYLTMLNMTPTYYQLFLVFTCSSVPRARGVSCSLISFNDVCVAWETNRAARNLSNVESFDISKEPKSKTDIDNVIVSIFGEVNFLRFLFIFKSRVSELWNDGWCENEGRKYQDRDEMRNRHLKLFTVSFYL